MSAKGKTDCYVYQDWSDATPNKSDLESMRKDESMHPNAQRLPTKLNKMLRNRALSGIMKWRQHGRSWRIEDREKFVTEVLPLYFENANYTSFVRLVNAWGFRRVTSGDDKDSYYHELFLRGMPHLHIRMRRLGVDEKKTPVEQADRCPDFDSMPALEDDGLSPAPPASHQQMITEQPLNEVENSRGSAVAAAASTASVIINQRSASNTVGGTNPYQNHPMLQSVVSPANVNNPIMIQCKNPFYQATNSYLGNTNANQKSYLQVRQQCFAQPIGQSEAGQLPRSSLNQEAGGHNNVNLNNQTNRVQREPTAPQYPYSQFLQARQCVLQTPGQQRGQLPTPSLNQTDSWHSNNTKKQPNYAHACATSPPQNPATMSRANQVQQKASLQSLPNIFLYASSNASNSEKKTVAARMPCDEQVVESRSPSSANGHQPSGQNDPVVIQLTNMLLPRVRQAGVVPRNNDELVDLLIDEWLASPSSGRENENERFLQIIAMRRSRRTGQVQPSQNVMVNAGPTVQEIGIIQPQASNANANAPVPLSLDQVPLSQNGATNNSLIGGFISEGAISGQGNCIQPHKQQGGQFQPQAPVAVLTFPLGQVSPQQHGATNTFGAPAVPGQYNHTQPFGMIQPHASMTALHTQFGYVPAPQSDARNVLMEGFNLNAMTAPALPNLAAQGNLPKKQVRTLARNRDQDK